PSQRLSRHGSPAFPQTVPTGSKWHVWSQQSPSVVFPSSHSSPAVTTPSPQTGGGGATSSTIATTRAVQSAVWFPPTVSVASVYGPGFLKTAEMSSVLMSQRSPSGARLEPADWTEFPSKSVGVSSMARDLNAELTTSAGFGSTVACPSATWSWRFAVPAPYVRPSRRACQPPSSGGPE